MARAAAAVLLALVAVSLVADASAQFCRTSAYKMKIATVEANKKAMFESCGASVKVLSAKQDGDCAVIVQQVKSEADWDAYSKCEKADKNKSSYTPLKENSKACEAKQAKGACPKKLFM